MKLSDTALGPFHLYTIDAGRFKLDGGAMFGVVPKTLWNRRIDADNKNRIPMAMRCLLVESKNTGNVYLVDNGIGTKFNDKMNDIYQTDTEEIDLISSLDYHGFTPDDVTDVIFTHLHFDHCGGTTFYDDSNTLKHTFKNARYHITEKHLQTAAEPNAREAASFLADNIQPIANSDRLNIVQEHQRYEEGLTAVPVNGHTLGQQLPKIEAEDKTVVFAADLIPTQHHVPLPWVMGYDMRPVDTLTEKETFLNEAVSNNWHLFLEHDAQTEVIQVAVEKGKYKVTRSLALGDI